LSSSVISHIFFGSLAGGSQSSFVTSSIILALMSSRQVGVLVP
jgi:hypothetical protein